MKKICKLKYTATNKSVIASAAARMSNRLQTLKEVDKN